MLAYRSFDQRPVSRGNLGASGMMIRTPIEDALFSVNGCVRCAGRPPSAGRNPMSSTGAGLAGTQSQSTVSPPKPPVHARTHARTTHRTTAPTLCRASQIGPKIGSHFSSSSTGAGSLPLAAPPLSQHASETKPGRVRPWLGVCNRSRVRRRGGCRRGRAVAVEVSASRRTYKWRTVRSRSRQGHWAIASTVCAGGMRVAMSVVLAGLTARRNVSLPDRRVTQHGCEACEAPTCNTRRGSKQRGK